MTNKPQTPNTPEPPPIQNSHPAVWSLVIADMQQRDITGAEKYGTHLQPFNGRDSLVDLYQELLDAVVYVRQKIYEESALQVACREVLRAWDVAGNTDELIPSIRLWTEKWRATIEGTEQAEKEKENAK